MISTIMMFLKSSDGPTPLWAYPAALGLLGVLAAAAVFYVRRRNKKRTAAFSRIAGELGWKFTAEAGNQWLGQQGNFPLFSQGVSRSVHYLMQGQSEGAEVSVFDLTIRLRQSSKTPPATQTVVCLRSGQLNLPSFDLGPENILHKLASAVGYQDIDIDTHPEFSKRNLLRGQDEPAIRSLFNPTLLSFFESFKSGITVAYADRMIYYRYNRLVSSEELRSFVDEALRVFKQLRAAQVQPQMKLGAAN